uniref:Pentacotripeptide-repeat region of PRORP domain-containing protein n=1 Tax=Alexandrium catenella TaxID=2925 RepID=A0A7S1RH82_ALECA|mmetsp:Transcript_58404/g.156334  ORF Transcript_58404/g.156334 Transcript_58404/m.156334 type:complete len:727 (+) Transcript_58404:109-2289(+)
MASTSMPITEAASAGNAQYIADVALATIGAAQTEIFILALAFFAHAVVFGKHRLGPGRSQTSRKMADSRSTGGSGPPSSGDESDVVKAPRGSASLSSLKTAVQEANLPAILSYLRQMPRSSTSPLALQSLLQKAARLAAEKEQALDIMREAQRAGVAQPWFYNTLLDACVECQNIAIAGRIMAEAKEVGAADVVTYNTMIKAHLRRGDVKAASAAVEAMRLAGVQPNAVTFNEMLDVAVRSDIKSTWRLVDEMKACGLQPNRITCSILLKCVQLGSRAADVDRALAALEGLGGDMDEVLLSSALEACIRASRRDLISRLLSRHTGARSGHGFNPHTYGSIIRASGFIGNVKGVKEAWEDMRRHRVLPTSITLGCTVEALVANKEPDAAHALLREVLADQSARPAVNAVIYCSILKGFAHQKRFDRVWALYEEMLAENLRSQFTSVTYNTIIDACSRCGEVARAPALLEEMVHSGIVPNIVTYSAVLKGLCQLNQLDRAFELVETMKHSDHLRIDEQTYNTLLDGCARQGLYSRGMKVFEEMKASGVRPSNFTLSILVKLANRGRQLEVAFLLADEVSRQYGFKLNVHVYNNLIQTCIAHKHLERALAVLDQMVSERCYPDERTHSLLLRGCLSVGDAQTAAGLVRSTLGLPNGLPKLEGLQASKLAPAGMLPTELLSEVVERVARDCRQEALAAELAGELRRCGVKVDARLSFRLARTAMGSSAGA